MKTIRRLLPILFLLSFVTAMMPAQPALSQGKNQGQGTTPAPAVTKTKIEVQENGGDFASPWVKALTITSADTLAFRYSTNEPAATSAIWRVSDKPFSSGPQIAAAQAPHVIASGALGKVPAPGHVSQFEVNFASFAPKTPPTSPKSYWVFVVTEASRGKPVGIASVPVKIVYHKSTQPPLQLFFPDPIDAQRIVFVSDRDGNAEIYKMLSDGSHEIRLTNNPAQDRQPSWNPAHTKIVFCRGGSTEIFVMNADGTDIVRLTQNSASDDSPEWSPDGSKIAFSSNRDGNFNIYLMNADGSNQKKLTNDPEADDAPTWSPDGSKIAFQSRRDGASQIYVINADGSGEKRLTYSASEGGKDFSPTWAPSNKIAFFRKGSVSGLFIMNGDGSNLQEFGGYSAELNFAAFGAHLHWGPNGFMVFDARRTGSGEIYLRDSKGKLFQLTNFGPAINNIEPDW
ncbi:MAG TPA: hypothetical protein VGJ55_04205 [Pyrinomonadaceae bacterium]|jgi:WD40 repeat protein